MPQKVDLKITGLNTNPSELGNRPGSLSTAKNINIDSPNTATSRRGFKKYGALLEQTGSGLFGNGRG